MSNTSGAGFSSRRFFANCSPRAMISTLPSAIKYMQAHLLSHWRLRSRSEDLWLRLASLFWLETCIEALAVPNFCHVYVLALKNNRLSEWGLSSCSVVCGTMCSNCRPVSWCTSDVANKAVQCAHVISFLFSYTSTVKCSPNYLIAWQKLIKLTKLNC